MTTQKFNVGDKVIEITHLSFGGDSVRKQVVAKIHKNGNFVLEGDPQQYTQSGYSTGQSRRHVIPYTENEWERYIKPTRMRNKKHRITKWLEQCTNEGQLDAVLTAMTTGENNENHRTN